MLTSPLRPVVRPVTRAVWEASAGGGAAPAFDPATLFGSDVVFYLPWVPDHWDRQLAAVSAGSGYVMWQDSAKTSPVTALGQSVGYVNDESGNGYDLSQATAGARPTIDAMADGVIRLIFDGTDDNLRSASIPWESLSSDKSTTFIKLRKLVDSPVGEPVRINASTSTRSAGLSVPQTATLIRGTHRGLGSAVVVNAAVSSGVQTLMVAMRSDIASGAASLSLRVNGVSGTPVTTDTGGGTYATGQASVGGRTGIFFNGGIEGLLIVRSIATDEQCEPVEAHYNGLLPSLAAMVGLPSLLFALGQFATIDSLSLMV